MTTKKPAQEKPRPRLRIVSLRYHAKRNHDQYDDSEAFLLVEFAPIQHRNLSVWASPATLLDYHKFQSHVLTKTGLLYICVQVEAAEPGKEVSAWHQFLAGFLEATWQPVPAEAG